MPTDWGTKESECLPPWVTCNDTTRKNILFCPILSWDKMWWHHFKPERKWQSQQWKHMNSPPPPTTKKIQIHTQVQGKNWCSSLTARVKGLSIFKHGATINAKPYEQTAETESTIKSKCTGKLSNRIILLHDNPHPHTANLVRNMLQGLGWEMF